MSDISLGWEVHDLPVLRTALNNIDLVRQSRLGMFIWIGGHPNITQDILIGQVNLKLNDFVETTKEDLRASGIDQLSKPTQEPSYRVVKVSQPVCQANLSVGEARVQMRYKRRRIG